MAFLFTRNRSVAGQPPIWFGTCGHFKDCEAASAFPERSLAVIFPNNVSSLFQKISSTPTIEAITDANGIIWSGPT